MLGVFIAVCGACLDECSMSVLLHGPYVLVVTESVILIAATAVSGGPAHLAVWSNAARCPAGYALHMQNTAAKRL